MSDSDLNTEKSFGDQKSHPDNLFESLDSSQDLLAEHILENVTKTPLGKVLKKIASMPEIRKGKVLSVRSKLIQGKYELNDHLDAALDKVLEELIA